MKTILELKTEIEELNKIRKRKDSTMREVNKAKKRVSYLHQCILYLETSPSEEFLAREIFRLEKIICNEKRRYDNWLSNQPIATQNALKGVNNKKFEKEIGIEKFKSDLTTIKFLAS